MKVKPKTLPGIVYLSVTVHSTPSYPKPPDVADLTPRVWKEVYGQSPMRSVLDDLKQ
ncbi:hypothetical protein [Teredinibacter franksiae]|uniref:hypothetical protein n=1 Tax=Teredinibacter franksiae TaxID=2761453 RepID=UPI001628EEEB|nr:hypothetical protein [Teredinibacter franksiae]